MFDKGNLRVLDDVAVMLDLPRDFPRAPIVSPQAWQMLIVPLGPLSKVLAAIFFNMPTALTSDPGIV